MFERFTEKARRVIFFARYEASQFGSPSIETEHLLLGLLREDRALARRVLPPSYVNGDAVRQQIEQRTSVREKVPTSVDLPLSDESKRALLYAAKAAEERRHAFISPDHLLLGLLQEKNGMAADILAPLHLDSKTIGEQIREPGAFSPEERSTAAPAQKFYGKYRGVVVSNMDPQQLGRVLTNVPATGSNELNWAMPCVPYPASGIPTLTIPPVGAPVWIEFEGGDLEYPIWSGCFWESGQPPLLKLP